ncbi:MAG: hypothetical protein QOH62_2811 [Solirubrobacteraceae bacterium]|nr:hypothetical protein [Solirubrobacteraceae bacterium]
MASKRSAGLLLFRRRGEQVEVLIAHMGGPFWARKDAGGWSIPKGEVEEGDEALATARREFEEELGSPPIKGELVDLGEVKQPSGKRIQVWALEGDLDVDRIVSNTFELEWPPRSGEKQEFPEVDRAAWVSPAIAKTKLVKGQIPFIDLLAERLGLPAEFKVADGDDAESR